MPRSLSATLLLLLSLLSTAIALPLDALKSLVLLHPTAAGPSSASCVAVRVENNLLLTSALCDVRALRFVSSVAEASFLGINAGRLQLVLTPPTLLETPSDSATAAVVELWSDATMRVLHVASLKGDSHLLLPTSNTLPTVDTDEPETSIIELNAATLQVVVIDHVTYVDTTLCASDPTTPTPVGSSVCVLPRGLQDRTASPLLRPWTLLIHHNTRTGAHTLLGLGISVNDAHARDTHRPFTWLPARFTQPTFARLWPSIVVPTASSPPSTGESRMRGPVVGTITTHHEFIVGIRTEKDGPTVCTGSLIAPRFVLTAAHCGVSRPITWVAVGAKATTGTDPNSGELLQVRRAHRHPQFTGTKVFPAPNDFVLLELIHASRRKPIALATDRDDSEMLGKRATMFGYGMMDSDKTLSNELRVAQVTLGPANDVCTKALGKITVDASMLCARADPDSGACNGDSGGPLVLDAGTATQRLLAITGGGVVNQDDSCVFGTVNFFLRIAAAREFLQSTMDKNKATTPRPYSHRPSRPIA